MPEVIDISTYVSQNATRGAALNNSTFAKEGRTFHLYATSLDIANNPYVMADNTATYASGKWDIGHTMYWPTNEATVDFYGWSPITIDRPSTVASGQINGLNYDTNCGNFLALSPDITLYKYGNDVVHKTIDGKWGVQDDLMQVIKANVKNPTQQSVDGEIVNTQIQLEFEHLLTHLKFKYKTEQSIKVRIKGMTLHNISSKDTWNYFGDGNSQNGWYSNLYPTPLTKANYHAVPMAWGNTKFVSKEDGTIEISGENYLMVLPQSVEAWNPKQDGVDYTIKWNDGLLDGRYAYLKSYLRIYCDIATNKDVLLFGDNVVPSGDNFDMPSEYCVYVPISSSDGTNELWKAGNQVTYTLTFGGGYDEDGKEILQPIKVTPELSDWIDSENVN